MHNKFVISYRHIFQFGNKIFIFVEVTHLRKSKNINFAIFIRYVERILIMRVFNGRSRNAGSDESVAFSGSGLYLA